MGNSAGQGALTFVFCGKKQNTFSRAFPPARERQVFFQKCREAARKIGFEGPKTRNPLRKSGFGGAAGQPRKVVFGLPRRPPPRPTPKVANATVSSAKRNRRSAQRFHRRLSASSDPVPLRPAAAVSSSARGRPNRQSPVGSSPGFHLLGRPQKSQMQP